MQLIDLVNNPEIEWIKIGSQLDSLIERYHLSKELSEFTCELPKTNFKHKCIYLYNIETILNFNHDFLSRGYLPFACHYTGNLICVEFADKLKLLLIDQIEDPDLPLEECIIYLTGSPRQVFQKINNDENILESSSETDSTKRLNSWRKNFKC